MIQKFQYGNILEDKTSRTYNDGSAVGLPENWSIPSINYTKLTTEDNASLITDVDKQVLNGEVQNKAPLTTTSYGNGVYQAVFKSSNPANKSLYSTLNVALNTNADNDENTTTIGDVKGGSFLGMGKNRVSRREIKLWAQANNLGYLQKYQLDALRRLANGRADEYDLAILGNLGQKALDERKFRYNRMGKKVYENDADYNNENYFNTAADYNAALKEARLDNSRYEKRGEDYYFKNLEGNMAKLTGKEDWALAGIASLGTLEVPSIPVNDTPVNNTHVNTASTSTSNSNSINQANLKKGFGADLYNNIDPMDSTNWSSPKSNSVHPLLRLSPYYYGDSTNLLYSLFVNKLPNILPLIRYRNSYGRVIF